MALNIGNLFKNSLNKVISKHAVVYDYANPADFNVLWNIHENNTLLTKLRDKTEIIVVWPELRDTETISPNDALLKKNLTPLDWALAFSIRMLNGNRPPSLSIHIIDLALNHLNEDNWGTRMRYQLLADMPWVKLFAPLNLNSNRSFPICESIISTKTDDKCYEVPLFIEDNEIKGSWKVNAKACHPIWSDSKNQLKYLSRQWKAFLSLSDNYHDVNNILGPELLTGEDSQVILKKAFLTRLLWSGEDLKSYKEWTSWDSTNAIISLYNRKFSLLVIDDQLDQGWGQFVCKLIGSTSKSANLIEDKFSQLNVENDKVRMMGCLGSRPLIEFLTSANFKNRNYFDQVVYFDDEVISPEIIMLDLRLYSGQEKAKKQALLLIDIANKVNLIPDVNLAWSKIPNNELSRILEWCNGSTEHANASDEALLLLPRLLALALPLTPIILFSSTGQAWIRERLKPYRNVFTGFEKPRVLSNPDSIKTSIAALHDALDKAVAMLRLRLQLAHAQKAIQIASDERPEEAARLIDQHIEIYADETRTLEEGIISGMAVCIFPDIQVEENLQKKLISEFLTQGVVWAKIEGSGNNPKLKKGSAIHKDSQQCSDQVYIVEELLNGVGLSSDLRKFWSVVSIKVLSQKMNIKDVSVASFPDAPLDEAIRFNLEFILFALIPYIAQDNWYQRGNICINIPTRVVPFPHGDRSQLTGLGEKFCDSFNLGGSICEIIDKKNDTACVKIPTANLSASNIGTAFPLIRGWLHSWNRAGIDISCRISKIKMAKLSSENNKGETKPITLADAKGMRLFHDVADWICTASTPGVGKELRECINKKSIFKNWFLSTDTEPISNGPLQWFEEDTKNSLALMRALNMSLSVETPHNSRSDILRLILKSSYVSICEDRLLGEYCAQQRLILWRMKNDLSTVTGNELHALLPIVPDNQTTEITVSTGVERLCGDSIEIHESNEEKNVENDCLSATSTAPAAYPISFPDSQIDTLFPNAQQFIKLSNVHSSTSVIDLKKFDSTGPILTHSVVDANIIDQIKLGKWCDPFTVLGVETDGKYKNSRIIKLLAAKLENGNWISFSQN